MEVLRASDARRGGVARIGHICVCHHVRGPRLALHWLHLRGVLMGVAKIRDRGRFGFGGNVREGREGRGITRADLAKKMNWRENYVRAMEENRYQPSQQDFERLQFVLGYPAGFFYRPDSPPGTFEPLMHHEDIEHCNRCIYVAEYLCDYPMGKGKTCDLPLCDEHAIQQGAEWQDMHFCPQHVVIQAMG